MKKILMENQQGSKNTPAVEKNNSDVKPTETPKESKPQEKSQDRDLSSFLPMDTPSNNSDGVVRLDPITISR